MSRHLRGPWQVPENDTFDGRAHYAAKSASDGQRRFLFGWNATREGERDDGRWQWGGSLVVHEIHQEPDGTLSVTVPESLDRAFNRRRPFQFQPGLGDCLTDGGELQITAPGSFGCAAAGDMPDPCRIEATLRFAANTRGCGLMLRSSNDYESAYYVRLEPGRNRLVFDSWPRAGDLPFMVGLERPLPLHPDTPVTLKVFVEGTLCEVYADNKIAMSVRLYNLPTGSWGVFVNEGAACFSDVKLSTPGGG
jgi:beta-fructofuranosidase